MGQKEREDIRWISSLHEVERLKIRELSDRVQPSGVCSVKLALAHRIASMERQTPLPQNSKSLIDRTYKLRFRRFLRHFTI